MPDIEPNSTQPPSEAGEEAGFPRSSRRAAVISAVCLLVAILAAVLEKRFRPREDSPASRPAGTQVAAVATAAAPAGTSGAAAVLTTPPPVIVPAAGTFTSSALPELPVNQAMMVTVELDFGPTLPGIAEALQQIERQHQPADGKGRTFAILDAYGGPTADGKKLHLSMHVSSEKPGIGKLIFRRTGETLWQSRIVPSTNAAAFSGQNLTVLLADGEGKTLMVDGSRNPANLLDARMRDTGELVRDIWPDGAEREVTYLYSACGCPVKVMVRRVGERTVRTKDQPVIFPDDPAVVQVISRLMAW